MVVCRHVAAALAFASLLGCAADADDAVDAAEGASSTTPANGASALAAPKGSAGAGFSATFGRGDVELRRQDARATLRCTSRVPSLTADATELGVDCMDDTEPGVLYDERTNLCEVRFRVKLPGESASMSITCKDARKMTAAQKQLLGILLGDAPYAITAEAPGGETASVRDVPLDVERIASDPNQDALAATRHVAGALRPLVGKTATRLPSGQPITPFAIVTIDGVALNERGLFATFKGSTGNTGTFVDKVAWRTNGSVADAKTITSSVGSAIGAR